MSKSQAPRLDGARLAVLASRFEGITGKMANTLLRTGRSGVLNRGRDFSCCIVTGDCELLATAGSLPIHVLSGPDMMAATVKQFHPELRPGDAFLHNSPYHGCSHAADHTIIVPVLDEAGGARFFVLAKAHQADIGNSIATTYHGSARDVYEEGALIFPAVKVQEEGRTIEDVVRMCEMRIRVAEQWKGDFLAMVGAARIGEKEILQLAGEIGWGALEDFTRDWFDYSEERMAAAIGRLPAGSASATSTHDPFPGTPEEGVRINATVTVDPARGRIDVDLLDTPEAMPCGLNLSEACSRTAAYLGVFNSVDHRVPRNAGSFRRIEVRLRENGVAGIPHHPTSCSVATTNVADRVTHAVQLAMAELGEGIGLAEFGTIIPPSTAVVSGTDPRTGKPFVNQLFLGCTGGAGSPTTDGWLIYLHSGAAGVCFVDSVELDELYQPIEVVERRLIPDTEGAGRFRGTPGLRVEYRPVGCAIELGYVSDGVINNPRGVRGGHASTPAGQWRRVKDGTLEPLPACAQVVINPGEAVISFSCGGGGYGPPEERNPERVRHDVREGWISSERAKSVYRATI